MDSNGSDQPATAAAVPHQPLPPHSSVHSHHLPHYPLPQYPYPTPQPFIPSINTASFQPAPPGTTPAPAVDPYYASYPHPYGYPIPTPPTYQDPNIYGANPSFSQLAGDVGINRRTKALQKAPKNKKIKIVQSFTCDVCKVDCNTKDVLDQHKLGKKHKKNLGKLVDANKNVIMDSGNQLIEKKGVEDLETKKSKVLKAGAAADSIRVCTICNVVCNSQTALQSHLSGQKHVKEAQKHTSS